MQAQPPRYAYRAIHANENPANGLFASKPNRNMSIHGHICCGGRINFGGSQYLSLSANLRFAVFYASLEGRRVVVVDLNSVPAARIIDVSTPQNARNPQWGLGITAINFAVAASEVLILESIPANAIVGVLYVADLWPVPRVRGTNFRSWSALITPVQHATLNQRSQNAILVRNLALPHIGNVPVPLVVAPAQPAVIVPAVQPARVQYKTVREWYTQLGKRFCGRTVVVARDSPSVLAGQQVTIRAPNGGCFYLVADSPTKTISSTTRVALV